MQKEKARDAIDSALTHLENSMRALAKKSDDKAVANSFWLASSETEYALFLFSLTHQERSENPSWKQSSQPKQQVVEVGPALTSAQRFLENAKTNLEKNATEKAYEETWAARNLLLKVQELFEKKQKSAGVEPAKTR